MSGMEVGPKEQFQDVQTLVNTNYGGLEHVAQEANKEAYSKFITAGFGKDSFQSIGNNSNHNPDETKSLFDVEKPGAMPSARDMKIGHLLRDTDTLGLEKDYKTKKDDYKVATKMMMGKDPSGSNSGFASAEKPPEKVIFHNADTVLRANGAGLEGGKKMVDNITHTRFMENNRDPSAIINGAVENKAEATQMLGQMQKGDLVTKTSFMSPETQVGLLSQVMQKKELEEALPTPTINAPAAPGMN